MIANFALTSLVIRKDDRWNRNKVNNISSMAMVMSAGRLKGISLLRG